MANKPRKIASILPHVLALATLVTLGGCYVEADGPAPPPRCGEAVWVRGHHDQYGGWHPGHYRCRGPRVVVIGSADSAAVLDRE